MRAIIFWLLYFKSILWVWRKCWYKSWFCCIEFRGECNQFHWIWNYVPWSVYFLPSFRHIYLPSQLCIILFSFYFRWSKIRRLDSMMFLFYSANPVFAHISEKQVICFLWSVSKGRKYRLNFIYRSKISASWDGPVHRTAVARINSYLSMNAATERVWRILLIHRRVIFTTVIQEEN